MMRCFSLLFITLSLFIPCDLHASYIEVGGVVVGEAELFDRRTNALNGLGWVIKPTENSSTLPVDGGPLIANARGGAYVQALPDNTGGGGPLVAPSIEYDFEIFNPGNYQLYVRWDGVDALSDSFFADIVGEKDGIGGSVADWYEFAQPTSGDFADLPWDAGAGFEQNNAGPANNPATWNLLAGQHTLRFSMREDGAAIDAWVLQDASLPAPTGFGPAITPAMAAVPEPSTFGIVAMSVISFGTGTYLRRRTQKRNAKAA